MWAAGIMLTVCLLGAFPFDHSAANIPGSTEDELDLWCAAGLTQGSLLCCFKMLPALAQHMSGSDNAMLCRTALPVIKAVATLCRKQEVNQGWANSEFIKSNVGALPPKCRELLDQIFEVLP